MKITVGVILGVILWVSGVKLWSNFPNNNLLAIMDLELVRQALINGQMNLLGIIICEFVFLGAIGSTIFPIINLDDISRNNRIFISSVLLFVVIFIIGSIIFGAVVSKAICINFSCGINIVSIMTVTGSVIGPLINILILIFSLSTGFFAANYLHESDGKNNKIIDTYTFVALITIVVIGIFQIAGFDLGNILRDQATDTLNTLVIGIGGLYVGWITYKQANQKSDENANQKSDEK